MSVEKYIITSCINNSKVFERGLRTLENYAEIQNATLLILPIRYNPSRLSQEEIIYDSKVSQYLQYEDFSINDKLVVLPEIKILPTAIRPLSGLASLGHESHTIIASPRLHLETIPSIDRYHPKFILTTGCITEENYTNTKTGSKAEFHHTCGAVIVEVDTETDYIHFRQVSLDEDGNFYDIDTLYTQDSCEKTEVDAIVFGDIHEIFLADVVEDKGFFGEDSLLKVCRPKYTILHDLLDQYTQSHHNANDPFRKYMLANDKSTIIDEINSSIEFVDDVIKEGTVPVIVSSNHNSHLTQWLQRTDWRLQPNIARDILKYTTMMLDAIDEQNNIDMKTPDLFRLILKERFEDNIIALDYNENFKVSSFETGLHGDKGLNGARGLGNIHNHINTKLISAHSHSAKRIDGHVTVGTSSELDRNYTFGLSTWSHTHAIIFPNSKAQLITQNSINGEYRINKKANSKMKTFKLLDKKEFEAHFTEEANDLVAIEEGMKYKVITDYDEIVYARSYRHICDLIDCSERFSRDLIRIGEKNGFVCSLLE